MPCRAPFHPQGRVGSFNPTGEISLAGTSIVSDALVGDTLTLFGAAGQRWGRRSSVLPRACASPRASLQT
jgi:hypothetical protein